MSNYEDKIINETDFDKELQELIPTLPPEDVISKITPFKKSINRVLVGISLTSITLNFLCLNYILPCIGTVLMLLGLRALKGENKWFKGCFVLAVIRSIYYFPSLILNSTIISNKILSSPIGNVLTAVNIFIIFLEFICLWQGFKAVQKKAGLTVNMMSGFTLILWYALVCVLALIQYNGYIISGIMIISYFFIIRNIIKLSSELDEAGYVIKTKPVKISDKYIIMTISLILTVGIVCGYIFGNSYTMKWSVKAYNKNSETEEIERNLKSLGFPDYVLNDLTKEEINSFKGATRVIVRASDRNEDGSDAENQGDIRFTGIGVQLPGDGKDWVIIHHFLWIENPGFYGTDSIQLLPTYKNKEGIQNQIGEVTGRILYDNSDKTFVADYFFLEIKNYTSNSIIYGKQDNSNLFASFSMPKKGYNHRGYLIYSVNADIESCIIDSWINYTHQQSFFQYPVKTATEHRMSTAWNESPAFITYQEQLQF